ncbi:MAG: phytanoyl-CoA dioxygenase family protein [Pseudomonadota bacterium]
MALTLDQKVFYQEHGYLVLERLLDETVLAGLRQACAEMVDGARGICASNALYDIGAGHGPNSPRVRRIKDPHQNHRIFGDLARSDKILDPVAELLGGTARFDHSKLNFKPSGDDAAIEWHQDWAFYPHSNDDLLAVGVMIEDCTADNGPLMVIPGSHRGPVYDHHRGGVFVGAMDPQDLGALQETAVELTAPAGSISLHHVRTVHGSRANRTPSNRPLLLFSYMAVDAFPLFERYELEEFNSRILRGSPTFAPRQIALPVRIPDPKSSKADSIFDDQESVQGRSFGTS